MILVPYGAGPAPVEVDLGGSGLFVGMQLYVMELGVPTPQGGVVPMSNFDGTSYLTNIAGIAGNWYIAKFKCYTDVSYGTVDVDQPQGAEILYFDEQEGGGGGGGGTTNVGTVEIDVGDNEVDTQIGKDC
jgi:hypothetical protein